MRYQERQAEQGWLNSVFHSSWFELSVLHNTNTAVFYNDKQLWRSLKPYIRALHLTDRKPFRLNAADFQLADEPDFLFHVLQRQMITSIGSLLVYSPLHTHQYRLAYFQDRLML